MHSVINWIYELAQSLGGPGIFVIALLDSFIVLPPSANDVLLVAVVISNPAWMPYYAGLATAGSVAGCYGLYALARRGGEMFLHRRVAPVRVERVLALYRRHGLMALMVPALLPPPAPFKLFVLTAGVAHVRPLHFVIALAIARGVRYFGLGTLAYLYGERALALMQEHGRDVALWVVGSIVATLLVWWFWKRRTPIEDPA